jgi:hypothetical protein
MMIMLVSELQALPVTARRPVDIPDRRNILVGSAKIEGGDRLSRRSPISPASLLDSS